jgi:hypothetical protein
MHRLGHCVYHFQHHVMGVNRLEVSFDIILRGWGIGSGLRQGSPTERGAENSGNQKASHDRNLRKASISVAHFAPLI